jgi:hypothetical protein
MNTEIQDEREPTPEEIAELRSKMKEYYKEQIPFHKLQLEYETILAEIEMARAKRVEMAIRIAQMTAGPKDEQPQPRKLKTD